MPPKFTFSLRDDTSVYIVPSGSDKVIVVFGFQFKEQTDKVIAHVLLQVPNFYFFIFRRVKSYSQKV